ncbi:DUF397 domain-containing protein [Allosalinactinospora lopnorensis]|uniref:DUF397 domain-containing protein n=1 Tax=Allosalinactinospora lopnorensis TaxID=1352348 RepID=UPI001F32E9BB|nr:DUF397 domain-containing protein [Allosalinactinospora lopnorensis]
MNRKMPMVMRDGKDVSNCGAGGQCADFSHAVAETGHAWTGWRSASYSSNGQNQNDCMQVRIGSGREVEVAVRDSKYPEAVVLRILTREWGAFLGMLKSGAG